MAMTDFSEQVSDEDTNKFKKIKKNLTFPKYARKCTILVLQALQNSFFYQDREKEKLLCPCINNSCDKTGNQTHSAMQQCSVSGRWTRLSDGCLDAAG